VSDEVLLRTREVAVLLRVHPKHVYRLLRRGMPARRVGGEWRFSRDDVLAWSGARPPAAAAAPAAVGALGASAPPPLVAANGDVVVVTLLALAAKRGPPLLGFVQADMREGAELLRARAVLATGAHAGGFPTHVGEERVARIHLVRREVGLLGPRGAPPPRLEELARATLASRPPSAGVRRHLDAALRRAGLDPDRVHRRALLLGSHLDVVTAVASGRVDVGLGSRAWGERAGLSFRPLASEEYGLIVNARDLGDPRVVRLCEVAQGEEFRAALGAVRGYDAADAGDIRYDAGRPGAADGEGAPAAAARPRKARATPRPSRASDR
jgi:putative molybdopterin biosynthesis protein